MKQLIALILFLSGSVTAFARTPYEDLILLRQQVRASCNTDFCRNGYMIQTAYRGGKGAISPQVFQTLYATAVEQSQIWADTILEGDYEVAGQLRLDEIRMITRAGTVVGYQIVYSDDARSPWGRGRIRETSWVHTNLQSAMVEEDQHATFIRQ